MGGRRAAGDIPICRISAANFWELDDWRRKPFKKDFAMTKIEEGPRAQNLAREKEVQILAGRTMLWGDLVVPDSAGGVVLFAHGSGSSRHSPRNRYVAQMLQGAGLATLLMDLLLSSAGGTRWCSNSTEKLWANYRGRRSWK